jgi:hypothetical protein
MRPVQILAMAIVLNLTPRAGGRVHLLQTPPQHQLRLQQVMQAAKRGVEESNVKKCMEDMILYQGELKPWQDPSIASGDAPTWLEDVKVTAEQLERAAQAEICCEPRLCGLGLRLRDDWKVTGMEPEGPAAESETIRIGDILHEVDGISVSNMDVEEAAPLIFGVNNSQVSLTPWFASHSECHTKMLFLP